MMSAFTIDIGEIAELTTMVAVNGAIRAMDGVGDEMFEYIVGVIVLVYEMYPEG